MWVSEIAAKGRWASALVESKGAREVAFGTTFAARIFGVNMSHHTEELQAKKYLEQLMSVEPRQWQWFPAQQCFEVGDAAARPRVYFDVEQQYETYILSVYLEVDRAVAGSSVLRMSQHAPVDHDDLLMHITELDQPPVLVVLIAKLLRNRGLMANAARPDHLGTRLEKCLTVLKQKVLVDLPYNVQQRIEMFKIERNASRVIPRERRG
ncbi:MAG TPA: hypothetical protein VHE55_12650 [Fimbriimonadaceae bacterium]|nr:hypothetical protein [Fimbriimonadaceae bacterium]